MKLAPAQWKGPASHLLAEILSPHFLPAGRIEIWKNLLMRRLNDENPVFVVGTPLPELRSRWGQEQIHLTKHSSQVIFSDRSPGVAVYSYLSDVAAPTTEKMAALRINLPYHAFDLDKFTRWASLTNNPASAGWMVARIFSGATVDTNWENLSKEELRRRSVLNLHPLNMFIFPNLNKSGTVFADDPRFHSLIAEEYRKRYGALFDEMLSLGGVDGASLPAPEDFEIDLSATGTAPASVKLENKDLISAIEAGKAFDLKLVTVGEGQGTASRLLEPAMLTRGFYDIKLDWKEKSGDIKTVGFYRLNLKELYEKKYLARDSKGVRLIVYKTEQGFAVGPKKTGPLTNFPA